MEDNKASDAIRRPTMVDMDAGGSEQKQKDEAKETINYVYAALLAGIINFNI